MNRIFVCKVEGVWRAMSNPVLWWNDALSQRSITLESFFNQSLFIFFLAAIMHEKQQFPVHDKLVGNSIRVNSLSNNSLRSQQLKLRRALYTSPKLQQPFFLWSILIKVVCTTRLGNKLSFLVLTSVLASGLAVKRPNSRESRNRTDSLRLSTVLLISYNSKNLA
jgi:hypothetical protein